ncbi:MAG: hypothetical protein LBT44_08015, partial [Clostridiales bacterium]|nr:hypothetical protein [Clostridiales bacterium]
MDDREKPGPDLSDGFDAEISELLRQDKIQSEKFQPIENTDYVQDVSVFDRMTHGNFVSRPHGEASGGFAMKRVQLAFIFGMLVLIALVAGWSFMTLRRARTLELTARTLTPLGAVSNASFIYLPADRESNSPLKKYRFGPLSTDLFFNAPLLQERYDCVLTDQQGRAYNPDLAIVPSED